MSRVVTRPLSLDQVVEEPTTARPGKWRAVSAPRSGICAGVLVGVGAATAAGSIAAAATTFAIAGAAGAAASYAFTGDDGQGSYSLRGFATSLALGAVVGGVTGGVGAAVSRGVTNLASRITAAHKAAVAAEKAAAAAKAAAAKAAAKAAAAKAAAAKATNAGRADFIANANGVVIPTSRSRLVAGFEEARLPSVPTASTGTQYTLPDGSLARIMAPSGPAPWRASFTNANRGPINPFTGKPVQPPRGMSPAQQKIYVRSRTHIELGP